MKSVMTVIISILIVVQTPVNLAVVMELFSLVRIAIWVPETLTTLMLHAVLTVDQHVVVMVSLILSQLELSNVIWDQFKNRTSIVVPTARFFVAMVS